MGMCGMGDMGMGMGGMGQENFEEQLLACRCLANLMEAVPGSAHHSSTMALSPCSKLLQITFIDLAEQTISVCPFAPQYH
jgi:E3 ubiquitin-protein ligase TRIP12